MSAGRIEQEALQLVTMPLEAASEIKRVLPESRSREETGADHKALHNVCVRRGTGNAEIAHGTAGGPLLPGKS